MGPDPVSLVSLSEEEVRAPAAQRPGDTPLRTHQEGGPLQAGERGLRRKWTCQHLDLALLAFGTVSK